jgi:Family of unknown function (DUF6932)
VSCEGGTRLPVGLRGIPVSILARPWGSHSLVDWRGAKSTSVRQTFQGRFGSTSLRIFRWPIICTRAGLQLLADFDLATPASDSRQPNDVDVFLVMDDTFDLDQVTGEARLVFEHPAAQAHFGTSVFWLRQFAAFPSEEEAVLGWQLKRDGTRRGIVEVTEA